MWLEFSKLLLTNKVLHEYRMVQHREDCITIFEYAYLQNRWHGGRRTSRHSTSTWDRDAHVSSDDGDRCGHTNQESNYAPYLHTDCEHVASRPGSLYRRELHDAQSNTPHRRKLRQLGE